MPRPSISGHSLLLVAATFWLISADNVFASTTCLAQNVSPKLNVVFIVSDDLSAEALGCYGNRQCRTPNIDRLAQRGFRFTRSYCQFPVCGPSRAALMSGTYPQCVGVTGNGSAKNFTAWMGERPSMTQLFREHGWHAERMSKIYHMRVPGDITNGVAGPDHEASWDRAWNAKSPEWMSKGSHLHLTKEKLKFEPEKHYNLGFGGAFYVVESDIPTGADQADVMAAEKAVQFLSNPPDEPFFLAVGFVRPHVPLVAPASFFEAYPEKEMQLPAQMENDWDDIPEAGISKNSVQIGLDSAKEKRQVLSAYYASVEFMDAQVGKILDAIESQGLGERTLVVFTSDHGYHLGEHEFWQKMSLREESTRIPLVLAGPGIPQGVSPSLVQQIDLYPTLANLNRLTVPEHVQGIDLTPLFEEPEKQLRDYVYCLRGKDHLLRTDAWSYLQYRDGSVELFDMRKDPKQFTNLANDSDYAELLERFAEQLRTHLQKVEQATLTPPEPN